MTKSTVNIFSDTSDAGKTAGGVIGGLALLALIVLSIVLGVWEYVTTF